MRQRALKAIIRNAFRKNGTGGATASFPVGIALVLSAAVVFSLIMGAWFDSFSWYWKRFQPKPHVLIYNAPDEFRDYVELKKSIEGEAGFGVIWDEHKYVFDLAYYSREMSDNNAVVTLVFDEHGDVLTFYPAGDLGNFETKEFIKEYLVDSYSEYITQLNGGIAFPEAFTLNEQPVLPPYEGGGRNPLLTTLAYMLIPLLFFISVLYASMTKGTNLIAGAKEQNAFAAILMTPVPRKTLVLGDVIGIWMAAMVPVLFISAPLLLVPTYRAGVLPSLIMMAVFAFFIASVVILISIMSSNVITAQTAFLPVFLIFIALCVTCMQNPEKYIGVYEYLPVYGQYLGIAAALTEGVKLLPMAGCCLSTAFLSLITVWASVKLLGSERFTVSVLSVSDKEIIKARKQAAAAGRKQKRLVSRVSVFGYVPRSTLNDVSFGISQLLRPLMLLSIFQLIALIPPLLMTDGEYLTNIMYSLKSVKEVSDVLSSGAEIIGVLMSSPAFIISMAAGYILIDIYYCLRVRLFERTPLSSGMGFCRNGIFRKYLSGALIGSAMIGSVFGILAVSGQIKIIGFGISSSAVPLLLSYMLMWLFQGACEEIMFRGYMMPRVASRYGLVPAIAVSSLLFCLFHGLNPGFSVLAFINLVLISVLYGLIAYYTGNIWIVCAAHTFWNFTQGNVFGLEVSGNTGNVSFIHTSLGDNASSLMTGGTFGPEGGLAVTIVTVIALVCVVAVHKMRKSKAG